jgi:hypothetical protein
MAIYRLLKDTSFDPDHLASITTAFEDVCRHLQLAQRDDPLRDLVAKAIIGCAETGERDVTRLRECAHRALQG